MKKSLIILIAALLLFSMGFVSCDSDSSEVKINFYVNSELYFSDKAQNATKLETPEVSIVTGYTFLGWYYDNESWNQPFSKYDLLDLPIGKKIDLDIYAHLVPNTPADDNDDDDSIDDSNDQPSDDNDTSLQYYTVNLVTLDGMTKGVGSLVVTSGSNASLTFKLDDDYLCLGVKTDCLFSINGGNPWYTVTIKNVKSDIQVELDIINKTDVYIVSLISEIGDATVRFDNSYESTKTLTQPESCTATVSYPSSYDFLGWSVGGYAIDGSEILSTDKTFEFTPDSRDYRVYANFDANSMYKIIYDANGGEISQIGGSVYVHTGFYSDLYSMQQTLNDNSNYANFVREGYVAIGYSTQKVLNFNGFKCSDNCEACPSVNHIENFSNMGGVCSVDKSTDSLKLYVVWAKQTDVNQFTTSEVFVSKKTPTGDVSVRGICINSYTGDSKSVVIPEQINNLPVISVKAGAFKSKNIKSLVLPKTILKVEAGAFNTAASISHVVYFDSLQYVDNSSFPSSIVTIVLNAQRSAVYTTSEGAFSIKYTRLRTLNKEGKKKLIFVAGSSSLNGINSRMVEEILEGEYNVINYGTNAQNSSAFMLDMISNYVQQGDLVVHAPEWSSDGSIGGNKIQWKLFRANAQCYDIFREVDMRNYTNYWNAWRNYQIDNSEGKYAAEINPMEYQSNAPGLDKYGDLARNVTKRTHNYTTSSGFGSGTVNNIKSAAVHVNRINQVIVNKGAYMVCSFGTVDMISFENADPNWRSICDELTAYFATYFDYPVISNLGTPVIKSEQIYDSAWHCNSIGRITHSVEITFDIKKFLEADDKTKDTYLSFTQREALKATEYPDYKDYSY